MLKYFVSYYGQNPDGSTAFGQCQVKANLPIRGMRDVELMAEAVKRMDPQLTAVVILNWRRFERGA